MKGIILGYDSVTNDGAIRGTDGNRYSFHRTEWKSPEQPKADMAVDFVSEDGVASQVYEIKERDSDGSRAFLGIGVLLITFFLGFIGTLVSRLAVAKVPLSRTIGPVLVHLVITMIGFIPFVGWIVYVLGTIYFMVKNYQLIPGSHIQK